MKEIIHIPAMDMLSLSILVWFIGHYLNHRFALLRDNYIPPAVTGGLLFALFSMGLYSFFDLELDLSMRQRDLLLLVFFSTVGLSARVSALASGGRALAKLVFVAAVFLLLQNAVGVTIALVSGHHFGYGLLAGSVSFAGGHGTAIAWGGVAEAAGLENGMALGIAFATFGLVAGGLVGGPIARYLMDRYQLSGPPWEPQKIVYEHGGTREEEEDNWLTTVLTTLLVLAVCISLGDWVNRTLADWGLTLPGFLTSMFVGIVITNSADLMRRPVANETVIRFGQVSLKIFLAMSMMSIQLWALQSAALMIVLVLFAQVTLMTLFVMYVVFNVMGRDYDAVVTASGFAGLGLGATPVAIANMDSVTSRFGPSPQALMVVPLVGAFFIDLLNAGTIKLMIAIFSSWFG